MRHQIWFYLLIWTLSIPLYFIVERQQEILFLTNEENWKVWINLYFNSWYLKADIYSYTLAVVESVESYFPIFLQDLGESVELNWLKNKFTGQSTTLITSYAIGSTSLGQWDPLTL